MSKHKSYCAGRATKNLSNRITLQKRTDPVIRRGSIPLTPKHEREHRCSKCGALCADFMTLNTHEMFCEVKK